MITGKVLVHCQRGVSRSAAIVAAYLMWKYKISLEEALQRVITARPVVCPNVVCSISILIESPFTFFKKKQTNSNNQKCEVKRLGCD
jgi:protein-tyrosine phosphatase